MGASGAGGTRSENEHADTRAAMNTPRTAGWNDARHVPARGGGQMQPWGDRPSGRCERQRARAQNCSTSRDWIVCAVPPSPTLLKFESGSLP